jgi:hypothetical protein
MSEVTKYRITNLRAQPLELHLPGRVLVLEPRGQAEVGEGEVTVPQLAHLARRRLVSVRRESAAPATPAASPPAPTRAKTRQPRKRRTP